MKFREFEVVSKSDVDGIFVVISQLKYDQQNDKAYTAFVVIEKHQADQLIEAIKLAIK